METMPKGIIGTSNNSITRFETRNTTIVKKNVLIVEDNLLNQQLLKRILDRLDTAVDIAGSLESAKSNLSQKDYDFVFMDVNLPDGFGDALAVEIKKTRACTKVYILTADIMIDPKATEGVIDGFLYKPIRVEEVQRLLRS